MGDFRITINAAGGHGCQREVLNGQNVTGCMQPFCPDCKARLFIEDLKKSGNMLKTAVLEHWPNTPYTVVDDLITGQRTGSFQ